jgi:hypothetical protein
LPCATAQRGKTIEPDYMTSLLANDLSVVCIPTEQVLRVVYLSKKK